MNDALPRAPRILLLAGDVRGNMGDRAIRAALCAEIRKVAPDAEVHVLSTAPERDAKEFGARIAGRTSLALVTRALRLRHLDFAVWGGGQLLQDDSSFVKNLYWALLLTWVRRVLGLRIVGCGLGIGPVTTMQGRLLARRALRQLDTLIVRDEGSAALAREMVAGRPRVQVAPDLVWFLPAGPAEAARDHLRRAAGIEPDPGELLVGVAVRRWFHLRRNWMPYEWRARSGRRNDDPRFLSFLDNLGDALREFANGRRVRVIFFPMVSSAWEGEAGYCRHVGERSGLPYRVLDLDCDAMTTRALTGLCGLFASVRMHSALLAMSMGVPTVTLPYVRKVHDLMASLGLGSFKLSIEEATGPDGARRIADLLVRAADRGDALRGELARASEALREGESVYLDALRRMIKMTVST